jgi:hypothetical protein
MNNKSIINISFDIALSFFVFINFLSLEIIVLYTPRLIVK